MSVYEIVKLVGTCVGLILGAIVFFVVFFRSMAWIDLWVKFKTGAERIRPRGAAKKRTRRGLRTRFENAEPNGDRSAHQRGDD